MNTKIKDAIIWLIIIGMLVAAAWIGIPALIANNAKQACEEKGGKYDGVYKVCLGSEQQEQVPITANDISPEIVLGQAYDEQTALELAISPVPEARAVRIAENRYVYPYTVGFGGTGNFLSLGLFEKNGDVYTHTSSLLVGDRVIFDSLIVPRVGTLVLDYLDRHSTESFAVEPTIPTQAIIELEQNQLAPRIGYVNASDNNIYLDTIRNLDGVIEINGFARGTWFFEATMPVEIYDRDYQLLQQTFTTPDEGYEWMTDEFVPFSLAVNNQSGNVGHVVFKRNNVSDIIENDASFTVFLR